jgi:phenylalanyl-tRNA synthetase beta chain
MKLPLSLIKSLIDIQLPPEAISHTLTGLGIEVDWIHNESEDPVFELSLTPNLGHCMSALGIARELSAALQIPLNRPAPALKTPLKQGLKIAVTVTDFTLCPRYMGRQILGVKIGPSPDWLKEQLTACGIKSINNAVDAANWIMMKVGQPLHAFDADRIAGKQIHVGPTQKSQTFLGLDHVEREVPAGALTISDQSGAVAIAGVMGSSESAVSNETVNILLEAACFDPAAVRAAAKITGLRTESSQRFEKGIDPMGIPQALDEACQLIVELCGGHLAEEIIDLKKHPFSPKEISCRPSRVNQLLGTRLSLTEMEEIFHRLGFKTQSKDEVLRVSVPLFRSDVNQEIDLVEEIARIYGYNHIEKTPPRSTPSQLPSDPAYLFEKELRCRLAGYGLQEFLSCDLISPKLAEICKEIAPTAITLLKTIHSKSEDYSVLRTSLLPGLLQVTKGNLDQKNQTLHAFEIGRIHFVQENQLAEIQMGAILLTGKFAPPYWGEKAREVDFYDLKGILENLLSGLQVKPYTIQPSNHMSFHPGRQAQIQTHGLTIGSFGEIHPALLEKFDIKQRVLFAELNLEHLRRELKSQVRMSPLPQFPGSDRDWTLSLPLDTLLGELLRAIHAIPSSLLEKVELIDLYQPPGVLQKNVTLRFTYRNPEKTVSFEEVESEHAKVGEEVLKLLAK